MHIIENLRAGNYLRTSAYFATNVPSEYCYSLIQSVRLFSIVPREPARSINSMDPAIL